MHACALNLHEAGSTSYSFPKTMRHEQIVALKDVLFDNLLHLNSFYFSDAYKYKILLINLREHSIKVDPLNPMRRVYEPPKDKRLFNNCLDFTDDTEFRRFSD